MSASSKVVTVARRSAACLTEIDPSLSHQVERALAEDPLVQPAERVLDPISLGALVVSIASLGWTIYRDIRKDCVAAKLDQAGRTERLFAQTQEDGVEIARLPSRITPAQHDLIIRVVAAEVVASDGPPSHPDE